MGNGITQPTNSNWTKGVHRQATVRPQPLLGGASIWFVFLCIFFLFAYLLVLPGGLPGYALALAALAVSLIGANRKTLAVFFLLSGPTVFGIILQTMDIAFPGSILSISIGFILLFYSKSASQLHVLKWQKPVFWLFTTTLVLTFFYLEGPQSEYSQIKLTWFVINLIIGFTVVRLLVADNKVNYWRLGYICIVSSVVYCAALFYLNPGILPTHFWETGSMRNITNAAGLVVVATNTVAIVASSGVVLMIGAFIDIRPKKKLLSVTVLIVLVGMIILNLIGERLFLLAPMLAILALRFCRPNDPRFLSLILQLLLSGIIVIVFLGLQSENQLITSLFTGGADVDERFNRSINWRAAIDLISEKPWAGHGLGGYYIAGYSAPGDGTYAHNLFLELLSEMGIVGTMLIIVPPAVFLVMAGRNVYLVRSASGGSLTPFLVIAFAHAMISHDLRQSAMLFAVIAVLWARLAGVGYARR